MARTRATLHISMWNPDSHFRFLTSGAQRLYFLILTQGDLSLCGITALTVERWSRLASDTKVPQIRKALSELVEQRYLVVDEDTQEVWVRTFTVHDGVLRQPNMVVSMCKDFDAIQSGPIREGFLEGLPEGLIEGLPQGYGERLAEPFREGMLRVRTRAPSPTPSPSPTPEPFPEPMAPKSGLKPFEEDFNECWEIYPRKYNRLGALAGYQSQRRKKALADDLLNATRNFAVQMKREARAMDVIMHGATFFGSHNRWEDYVKPLEPEYVEPVALGAGPMFPPGAEGERLREEFYSGEPVNLSGVA